MANFKRKYISRYDQSRNKIILIDSETGEQIEREDDPLTALLKYLEDCDQTRILRKFAIWCARQPSTNWKPIVYKMFRTAEEYLHGDISSRQLDKLYADTEGIAISTDTVGLRRGQLNAPLLLAARACINPSTYQAALEAAHYHRIWVQMKYQERNRLVLDDKTHKIAPHQLEQVTQTQIDRLLELMP